MTSLSEFEPSFNALWDMGLRYRPSEDRRQSVLTSFYQVLEKYPLPAVIGGQEQLQATATSWPAPANWIAAMPRRDRESQLPEMDWRQLKAFDAAYEAVYEGEPCGCVECREAEVSHLPIRYVPMVDASGALVQRKHPRLGTVYVGEFIHGYRLKNWWRLRGEFFSLIGTLEAMQDMKTLPIDERMQRLERMAKVARIS